MQIIAGDHAKNAKFAITVARKAGAVIFALPEGMERREERERERGEGEKRGREMQGDIELIYKRIRMEGKKRVIGKREV